MSGAPTAVVGLVVIPLLTAIVTSLIPDRRRRTRGVAVICGALGHAAVAWWIAGAVATHGLLLYAVGGWSAPLGIVLMVDAVASLFSVVLVTGHLFFVAFNTLVPVTPRREFWVLAELMVAALSGIVVAGDLFNLFVFVELASVSAIGMVTIRRRAEGAGAGFLTLLVASLSGVLFLFGVVILYAAVGSLSLTDIARAADHLPQVAHRTATALFTASFGMKFGLVPLHFWQAPAYDAAGGSVAAFLSGTAMNVYLYALIRILIHVLRVPAVASPLASVVLVAGVVNIVYGHLFAMVERNVRRLLAFSSVAHVGYILTALAVVLSMSPVSGIQGTVATAEHARITGPETGIDVARIAAAALLLHVVFHAVMKSTAFYAARLITDDRNTPLFTRWRNAATTQPAAFAAFVLAAAALVGIPPMSGFFSKWRVAESAFSSFGTPVVLVIAAGTVMSMAYYMRVVHTATSAVSPAEPDRVDAAERDRLVGDDGMVGTDGMSGREGRGPGPRRRDLRRRCMVFMVAGLGLATLLLGVFGTRVESALQPAARALIDADRYRDVGPPVSVPTGRR